METGSLESLESDHRAVLPESLRSELVDGLVSLDATGIAGLIRRTAEVSPSLGSILERHAGQLRYTGILRALQACGDGT